MILKLIIIIISTILMEGFAWFFHKYVMHGFLWFLHKSHHSPANNLFEKNDIFSLFFAAISCSLIIVGNIFLEYSICIYIGFGILLYGVLYFIFHDIIVHKRVNIKFIVTNKYLKTIIKAHHIHHKLNKKNGGQSFGFLYTKINYMPKKVQ